MNLTKCFAAGLCLTAMTASAAFLGATNGFEGGTLEGTWYGVNSSAITNVITGVNDAKSPIVGNTDTKVLKLDTEGSVWTNVVTGGSFQLDGNKVFTDMLVKFVPSEELPTVGSDVKLAVAVLAGTPNKLAISAIDQLSGTGTTNVWIVTTGEIDTNAWTRLTIEMGNMQGVPYAYVKTNGVLVDFGGSPDANILGLNGSLTLNLESIGFSGTGFIDEITVSDSDPLMTAILLTLNFAAGIDSVYVGGTAKTTGQTVTSPAELVITASQWKEIASLTGPAGISWGAGGIGSSVATVTVSNASATNVTITAQNSTSAALLTGTSFTNAPISKVAAWAIAKRVTEAGLTSDMYDRYLFDLAADGTVPTMLITGISVSGSTVTVTVTAGTSNLKTGINGTLKIKSYATLGATPTVRTISFVDETADTITCDIGTDNFVKATVE